MPRAISNTFPILYLYRTDALELLNSIFEYIVITESVADELKAGRDRGYNVPDPAEFGWIKTMNPRNIPNEWLSIDLGKGESATIALALENSGYIVLLDDYLARRIAKAAGLTVWGTLRVLFEAKKPGLIPLIKPIVTKLQNSGMWLSDDLIKRILSLVGE